MLYRKFIKRIFIYSCLLTSLVFKPGFATEGVNIYTVQDGKTLILLSQEKEKWTDFTGNANSFEDFVYAAKQTNIANRTNIMFNYEKIHSELNLEFWKRYYTKSLSLIPNFTKFLFMYSAGREAHEETMGVFFNPQVLDPQPEQTTNNGSLWFLSKFNESYKINITIPTPKRPRMHVSWFVKVDYIPANHFNAVLQCLKKPERSTSKYFIEKQAYVWIDIETLLVENGNLNNAEKLNLATPFYEMIKTSEAQNMLKKIIN